MSKCKCTMSISALGDGCRHCQPQTYIDNLETWLCEERARIEEIEAALRMAVTQNEHDMLMTGDELHAMADRIGVQRKWHQKPGTYKSHYDIALSKRAIAVDAGAVEIRRKEVAALLVRKREALAAKAKPPQPAGPTEDELWAQADMNIHRMKVSGELRRRADHRALLDQIQHGNMQ